MTEHTNTMDREQAIAHVRTIYVLSGELERSGHRDLETRAAEIHAMAHYMLYDVGAGERE